VRCTTGKYDGEQPSVNGRTSLGEEDPHTLVLATSANVRANLDATAHPNMRWKFSWDALEQHATALWIHDATSLHGDHRRTALWNCCSSSNALTLSIAQWRGTECVTCSRISNTGESPRRSAGQTIRVSQRCNPAIHCRNVKWGVVNSRAERLCERPTDQ
jgi:hypothetical protein